MVATAWIEVRFPTKKGHPLPGALFGYFCFVREARGLFLGGGGGFGGGRGRGRGRGVGFVGFG